MWQLYSEGRYAEPQVDRRPPGAETGWQPPADLLDRLDVAEARARLVNASDLKQYTTVVQIGAATSSLLTCADIDVLWRVAEAFARTDRMPRAQGCLQLHSENLHQPAGRLATVQKASGLLPYAPMQVLLGLGDPMEMADANSTASVATSPAISSPPAMQSDLAVANYLTRVAAGRERRGGVGRSSAGLVSSSPRRLRRSGKSGSAPDARKGGFDVARAGADADRREEGASGEDVMYKWRGDSKDATATYRRHRQPDGAAAATANIAENVLNRIATEIPRRNAVPTAQQFGWYALSQSTTDGGARWFETALRWKRMTNRPPTAW